MADVRDAVTEQEAIDLLRELYKRARTSLEEEDGDHSLAMDLLPYLFGRPAQAMALDLDAGGTAGVIVAPGQRSAQEWIDKEKGQMGEGGEAETAGEVREVTQFAEAGLVFAEPIRVQIVEEEGETVAKPPEPIDGCWGFGDTPEAAIEDAGWHIAAMRESLINSVEAGRPLGRLMQRRHDWLKRVVSIRG